MCAASLVGTSTGILWELVTVTLQAITDLAWVCQNLLAQTALRSKLSASSDWRIWGQDRFTLLFLKIRQFWSKNVTLQMVYYNVLSSLWAISSAIKQTKSLETPRRAYMLCCCSWDFLRDDTFTVSNFTRPIHKELFTLASSPLTFFWRAGQSSFRIVFFTVLSWAYSWNNYHLASSTELLSGHWRCAGVCPLEIQVK